MLEIVKVTDPDCSVLFKQAESVETFDADLNGLLDEMHKTMQAVEGLGLSAPQVGRSIRAVVLADTRWPELINPVAFVGANKERRRESCLSIPDRAVEVERPTKAIVETQDRKGNPIKINARGPLARLLLHEIDHLDGILITTKRLACATVSQ